MRPLTSNKPSVCLPECLSIFNHYQSLHEIVINMKKSFAFIIFCLFICQISHAQTQKGRFLLSGSTNVKFLFSNLDPNYDDVVDNSVKTQEYGVNAGFGYFIVDNLAVNINGAYDYTYSKKQLYLGPVYEEIVETTIAVVPSVIYFFPVEGNLKPHVELGAGYVSLKERNNGSSTPNNVAYHYAGLSINGGAGVSYFFSKHISADLGFQYSRNKLTDKTNERRKQIQNNFGVMAGISFYF